jgi:GR25 family glycosyltransferase involved in LPS biosynthesis
MVSRLNEIFDKIVCINLKKRTDRKEMCEKLFAKHNVRVEFVTAIDTTAEEHPALKNGYVGLNQTWVSILDMNQDVEKLLVLEDDVQFSEDFEERLNTTEIPEDWYALYLGGLNTFATNKVSTGMHYTRYTLLGHAVGLKLDANSREDLKNRLESMKSPSDVCIADTYFGRSDRRSYSFVPGIAKQIDGFSDCDGRKKVNQEVN